MEEYVRSPLTNKLILKHGKTYKDLTKRGYFKNNELELEKENVDPYESQRIYIDPEKSQTKKLLTSEEILSDEKKECIEKVCEAAVDISEKYKKKKIKLPDLDREELFKYFENLILEQIISNESEIE
jgi:hypothetical protein